jgi:RNAse (barnase) inhibitor barstar
MTRETPSDRRITTSDAFERSLTDLFQAAHANGVDVDGAWECRTNDHGPDWEAVITELAMKADG